MAALHFKNIVRETESDPSKPQVLQIELDSEKMIQAYVYLHKIRINEFFRDFDPLRKGYVKPEHFRTGLGTLKIALAEHQIQNLWNKYKTPDNLYFLYKNFCENINVVFADPEKAKAALQKYQSRPNFSNPESERLNQLLVQIKLIVDANRISLKPKFQDFDRINTTHVSTQQFERVLKDLNLLPVGQDLELLERSYLDKNSMHEINYLRFCHGVDASIVPKQEVEMRPPPNSSFTKPMVSTLPPQEFKKINVLENRFLAPSVNLHADPTDIEDRIRAKVVEKNIRIDEFFKDYDKLKKRTISMAQFRRVLSLLSFNLTETEFQALENKYKTSLGLMDYFSFSEKINSTFTEKWLEKDPLHKVPVITQQDSLLARRKKVGFEDDELEMLDRIIKQIRITIKQKGLCIKPFFQDYDRTRTGFVTNTIFLRVLCLNGLEGSPEVMNLIVKKYLNRGTLDEVNYYEFIRDVDLEDELYKVSDNVFSIDTASNFYKKKAQKLEKELQIDSSVPNDLEDILSKIRKKVKESSIRLKEFFRDFDKLRSGKITQNQFRGGLNMANIHLSSAEYDLIINGFKTTDSFPITVKYGQFCDEIEKVFTTKCLEKDPNFEFQGARTAIMYGKPQVTPADAENCKRVLSRFKVFLTRDRLDAKSFFHDWDRHNRFKVTPKQFRQALAHFNFQITEEELEAVIKFYKTETSTEICYLKFLNDSRPDFQIPEEPYKEPVKIIAKEERALVCERLMEKLKTMIMKSRIRFEEFIDYDPLRKGHVPQIKFRGILDNKNVKLSLREYELLEDIFRSDLDRTKINYMKFCHEIDKIFVHKDIEKDPLKETATFKVLNILDPEDLLTDDEEKIVVQCLNRIGWQVQEKRLLLKPQFKDKDITKSGFVRDIRFRSILNFYNIHISEIEWKLLTKRFMKSGNEINYIDFINVLNVYSGDQEMNDL